MEHEFTVLAAWMSLAGASVAGYFGLRMCRAMLQSPTATDLRREAALSMLTQANTSRLNSHQLAAVFRDLSECGTSPGRLTRQARSLGGTPEQWCIEHG